tara:strand:+ start:3651 stop:3962 length:312 start_codon:yes stop_codon:yes gene_type:complete
MFQQYSRPAKVSQETSAPITDCLDAVAFLQQYMLTQTGWTEEPMADLTKDEIRAMGKAVGLEINDPELTEVMYSLNALLESLDAINPPGLNDVEPLPIILPPA